MLRIHTPVNQTSIECLVNLWAERYIVDLSTLCSEDAAQVVKIASPEERANTVAKLQRLIEINCECAGIKTDILFSYIPNVVNLSESQRLAHYVLQVYEQVLNIYKHSSPSSSTQVLSSLVGAVNFQPHAFRQWAIPLLEMPDVEELATATEPVLQQLRKQHQLASNTRAIGFLSTQFHLTTELLLKRLTHFEQILLSPYFRFIEEQVCIPLQRVCQAAAKHHLDSPNLAIVRQLLPHSHEIASVVYHRASKRYANHRSQRGGLSHPGVMASTIRDLQMMQAYLWLCVLEESTAVVEQELLPLCVMVFPSVQVSWTLVRQMLQLLLDELVARLEPEQKRILLPYTQAMQQLFCHLEA